MSHKIEWKHGDDQMPSEELVQTSLMLIKVLNHDLPSKQNFMKNFPSTNFDHSVVGNLIVRLVAKYICHS